MHSDGEDLAKEFESARFNRELCKRSASAIPQSYKQKKNILAEISPEKLREWHGLMERGGATADKPDHPRKEAESEAENGRLSAGSTGDRSIDRSISCTKSESADSFSPPRLSWHIPQ